MSHVKKGLLQFSGHAHALLLMGNAENIHCDIVYIKYIYGVWEWLFHLLHMFRSNMIR